MDLRRAPSPRAGSDAADGSIDVVRRRARFDVSRRIADATRLRRLVELARDELRRQSHPQTAND